MDRFHVPELPHTPGAELELAAPEAHHLARVKRIAVGERVLLFDGGGREAEAEVAAIERGGGRVRLRVLGESGPGGGRALGVRIALGVAPPKGKRAQALVEKATELGAAAIFPLATARAVVDLRGREEAALEKWRRWAIEAAKQSGVRALPELGPARSFAEALAVPGDRRIILDPRAGARPLREILAGSPAASVTALVGPEGGFTEDEVTQAVAAGFIPARLGPTVLRVETAAIATVAAIAVAWG